MAKEMTGMKSKKMAVIVLFTLLFMLLSPAGITGAATASGGEVLLHPDVMPVIFISGEPYEMGYHTDSRPAIISSG